MKDPCEKDPCEDAISRETVIETLKACDCLHIFELKEIIPKVKKIPSVKPSRQWIPVSERLPEENGRYYVTRHDYVTQTDFIDILWYEKGIWWNRQSTGDYAVIAWMPLPESYKEMESDEFILHSENGKDFEMSKEEYKRFCENNPNADEDSFIGEIVNGTPIPDNATNGDVIKAMFPDAEIHLDGNDVFFHHMGFWIKCNIRWWNAPYLKGGKE